MVCKMTTLETLVIYFFYFSEPWLGIPLIFYLSKSSCRREFSTKQPARAETKEAEK